MSQKIDQIVEELKTLTLLEASELVKKIEETFGVDASAAMGGGMVMAVAPGAVEEVEEKTEFDLILEEVPADKKIAILKVVRSLTGLGLKEAKDLVDGAPKPVKEGIAKEEADIMPEEMARCFPDLKFKEPEDEDAKLIAALENAVDGTINKGMPAEFVVILRALLMKFMDIF